MGEKQLIRIRIRASGSTPGRAVGRIGMVTCRPPANNQRRGAEMIWPDLDAMDERQLTGFESVAMAMSLYAARKREALRAHRQNNKRSALAHETMCEEIYKQLPKEAQWRNS